MQDLYDAVSPVIAGKKYVLPALKTSWLEKELNLLAFRNESVLYRRNCDLSGRPIISIYAPDAPFKVFGQNEFWSDDWNALDYGRDYNFGRPFFEQFAELRAEVPRLSTVNKNSENSEYCNYSFSNKNCYLLFGSHYEEDCMYGRYSTKNKDCVDYFWTYGSELCYECAFSANCHRSQYLDHCQDCNDCYFSMDLKGCSDCIFCYGLRHKKYHIYNKEYSKEEYADYVRKLNLSSYKARSDVRAGWENYKKENAVFRAQYQVNCQNCEGTEHQNSKNLESCFACSDCEDCKFGFQMDQTYTSIDNSHMGYDKCELCYKCIGCNGTHACVCCDSCWHDSELMYCNLCFSSSNCFGCVGIRHNKYCILNKQYTKEEYEALVPRIIEHMKSTGEWGEFFPVEISPFAYNETVANEIFPMSRDEVLAKGWRWRDENVKLPGQVTDEVPDDINDVDETICEKVLTCEISGKQFKILPQELVFYKKLGIPVPRRCADQRIKERVDMSTFMKVYERECAKTGVPIKTVYGPDRAKIVYSEDAYLSEIY